MNNENIYIWLQEIEKNILLFLFFSPFVTNIIYLILEKRDYKIITSAITFCFHYSSMYISLFLADSILKERYSFNMYLYLVIYIFLFGIIYRYRFFKRKYIHYFSSLAFLGMAGIMPWISPLKIYFYIIFVGSLTFLTYLSFKDLLLNKYKNII